MSTATWGTELKWTVANRWRRNKAPETSIYNAAHITEFCGKSTPVSKMGRGDFWAELVTELMDKRLTNSTINRIISAGSTVLKCTKKAGRHGIPMPDIDRMKENQHRVFYYTKDQLRDLIKASVEIFGKKNLADAILFSSLTGVRQGELMKLKPCDIDLEKNLIWVGGMPHLIPKGNKTRPIPIAKEIQAIIRDRMDYNRLFGDDWRNKDQLYRTFKKVRNYLGIPETHIWHSLRDTFGTMICEVHHPKQAQDLLGHSDIGLTLKYCHPSEDANRAAVNALSIGVAL